MNNIQEIDRLLTLFYEGEISPDDVAKLTALMREAHALPERLEADKAVILALDDIAEQETDVPEGLESRIADAIDKAGSRQESPKRIHIIIRRSLAIAASLALVAVASWLVLSRPANEMAQGAGSEPKVMASAETGSQVDTVVLTDTVRAELPEVKPEKQQPARVASVTQPEKNTSNAQTDRSMKVDARALSARIIRFADEVSAARSSARMAMELMAVNMRIAGEKIETAGDAVGVVGDALNSIPNLNNIIHTTVH